MCFAEHWPGQHPSHVSVNQLSQIYFPELLGQVLKGVDGVLRRIIGNSKSAARSPSVRAEGRLGGACHDGDMKGNRTAAETGRHGRE